MGRLVNAEAPLIAIIAVAVLLGSKPALQRATGITQPTAANIIPQAAPRKR